jgi:mRNA interferase MazF
MLKRGCVYWARIPEDKRRPILVLSPDARNNLASDVIVAPISTVLRDGPWHVRLRKDEAGVPQTSIIKCEQITTLRKEYVSTSPLGRPLSGAKMAEVERAVLRAIGIPVPK